MLTFIKPKKDGMTKVKEYLVLFRWDEKPDPKMKVGPHQSTVNVRTTMISSNVPTRPSLLVF